MKRLKQKIKSERGQGLVEFALILPLFLFLVLGMLEFGWLLNAKITVNSTAKDVARTMIVAQGTEAEKLVKANTIINNTLGADSGRTIPTLPSSGETLVIVITDKVTPLIGLYVKGEQEIVGSASMRME